MDMGVIAVKRIIIIAAAVTLASAGSALAGNYGGGQGGGCGSSCGGGGGGGGHPGGGRGGYGGGRSFNNNFNSNVNVNVNANANANANANSYAGSYAASARSLIQARSYSGYGQHSIGGGGGGYVSVSDGYYGGGDIGGYGGGLQLAADCGCIAGVSAPFGYPVSGFGRRLVSQRGSYASYYSGGQAYGYAQPACCAPAPVAAPCCTAPVAVPACGAAFTGGYGNRYGSRGGACNTYAPPPPPPVYVAQPGVRVAAAAPVAVPPQIVYVEGPPVWVDAPPVNVAPAQIVIEQPNIRVRPSEVNVAPPEIHFVPAQDRPEEDCCIAASGPVGPIPFPGEADHPPHHPRSGPNAYVDGAPVPAYRNEREAAEYFQ
jgi:hypothetical protein